MLTLVKQMPFCIHGHHYFCLIRSVGMVFGIPYSIWVKVLNKNFNCLCGLPIASDLSNIQEKLSMCTVNKILKQKNIGKCHFLPFIGMREYVFGVINFALDGSTITNLLYVEKGVLCSMEKVA